MKNNASDFQRRLREDLVFRETLRGQSLILHSTWGLFSPRQVDEGSRLLLDHLQIHSSADSLDLGCGYGVLGLVMARLAPAGHTVLVDKDFVAIEYARKNARINGIDNCEVFLSNGFSEIGDRHFDLIVSNLPAKVGKELLYLYLYDAFEYLRPGGAFYVVTISGLRRFIERGFREVFGNYDKVKQGKSYTVAKALRESS
jgi:16S rRNA (guanine1207-N2)-methyltransferase